MLDFGLSQVYALQLMIRAQRCENCKYINLEPTGTFECRKHPPKVSVFLVPGPNNQPQTLNVTAYPSIDPNSWCGEHTAGIMTGAVNGNLIGQRTQNG